MKKSIHEQQKSVSTHTIGVRLYSFAFVLFIITFCMSRFILIQEVVAAWISPRAVLSDLVMAVLIALLAVLFYKIHLIVSVIFLFLLAAFHVASMEMTTSLNTFINISDLRYATDGYFMKSSLSNLTFPWYTVFLLLNVILYLITLYRTEKSRHIRTACVVVIILPLIIALHFLTPKDGEWHSSNLLWLSITRSIARPAHFSEYSAASEISTDVLEQLEAPVKTETEPYFRKAPNSIRNVLVVVIDGIPGVYVRQVQEYTGVKYPVEMQNLSRIAENTLIVPNFVAHNRQTMRGLYSILTGDYCKLTITTPKIYEYLHIPRELRLPCLPDVLAKAGYTTAYLQAADLAFMSKDRFMSASGFQQVMGKEYFQYQYVPFGWGPDDKAFFEQAGDFIIDMNKKSKPWFITLLNVGTHHPYAVPEELYREFPTRKAAAVAYLDEALNDFVERLREKGVLDETLLIITSDESHGVSGQPYGNYWGLFIAHSPESFTVINPGVFGLIDVPHSILDYLDLTAYSHFFPKRSTFRELNEDRTILFSSYFSDQKGIVMKRINSNCVKIFQSSNGELFSPEYRQKIVNAGEGRKLSDELEQYRVAADSSLYRCEEKNRTYTLLENDVFIVGRKESRLLSSGQYLDIPGGASVTVELEATAELIEEYRDRGSDASIRLFIQMLESYEKMTIPEISIPALRDRDSLQLSFSFYTEENLTRIWAYLKAISVNASHATKLTIKRFSIESKECETIHDFRINHFFMEGEGHNKRDLRSVYISSGREYNNLHLQNRQSTGDEKFGEKNVLEDGNSQKKAEPVIVQLKFDRHAYEIAFAVDVLDKRYEYYRLSIHFEDMTANIQSLFALLNDCQVACVWFDKRQGGKEVIMHFERSLLKENNVNNIYLPVYQSISDKEVFLTSEGKPEDFEIVSFTLQPCPPPVAHAGGDYRGLLYTNSIEALENNSSCFQLFEIDFEWTRDDRLIGLHDWGDGFVDVFGFKVDGPLDYDTICQLKTVNGFTPLDLTAVREFFVKNPSARIVTDVKSGNINALRKIAEFFPDFAERFIAQIYQPDEFVEVINIGYKDLIWTLYRYPHIYEPAEIMSHINRWEDEYAVRLFAVTIPVPAVEKEIVEVLMKTGIPVYAHTVNMCDEYVRLIRLGVSSIYTDYVDVTKCFVTDSL